MESLSDTKWDIVISGTGLQPSLLALALSRSDKKILHVDSNDYYGGPHAAFSLQEIDEWAERHRATDAKGVFAAAQVFKESEELAPSRAYSLALAPQLIHTRSQLLSQLVSSKAFRQIEFLAVGSFYIYQAATEASATPTLARIPSTREDVFLNKAIPARSKRFLMKFLKFVLEYQSEEQTAIWSSRADEHLTEFLASEFKLDKDLQSYVVALTLSLDGKITVRDGLASIYRHLSSMGVFGPGFAAVYPKWGGLSEVAQVGCRAAAVGGAVYALGTGIKDVQKSASTTEGGLEISLTNGVTVEASSLAQESELVNASLRLSRLTAVIDSNLPSLFVSSIDGAPTPAVGVVAFPSGSVLGDDEVSLDAPVYAMAHSGDTGECPGKQCIIYLSTISSHNSASVLQKALTALLAVAAGESDTPKCLYRLSYEQNGGPSSVELNGNIATFGPPSLSLAFDDSVLDPVQEAWNMVTAGDAADEASEYMKFEDREGQDEDEDVFDS